jgi:hypothetical protein
MQNVTTASSRLTKTGGDILLLNTFVTYKMEPFRASPIKLVFCWLPLMYKTGDTHYIAVRILHFSFRALQFSYYNLNQQIHRVVLDVQ